MRNFLTASDKRFLDKACKFFKTRMPIMVYDDSKKIYPDIWCTMMPDIIRTTQGLMTIFVAKITITDEWIRQPYKEREKRLTHEFIHFGWGMKHDRKLGYNSHPEKDSYSMEIYRKILRSIK